MDEIETLYRRHAAAVFRFAWGLCGDRSSAEDLVSETFERLLTRAPRIETRRWRCRYPMRCTPERLRQKVSSTTRSI